MKARRVFIGALTLLVASKTGVAFGAEQSGSHDATATENTELTAERASDGPPLRLDLGLTFSRFEQQVKSEVGGQRGKRLVEQTELGLLAIGAYAPMDVLSLGLFAQADFGFRSAGDFSGFDANDAAQLENETGGSYRELWVGPLVRGSHGPVFVELGWGALGLRWDEARDDLPSETGDTESAFSRSPTIAWLLAAGAAVPIGGRFDLALRLEYRVRYYLSRGGDPLANNVAHGTQSFAPFFGVRYVFDRPR